MADLAGNSIRRALNLGTFSNRTFSARDRIGGGDRSDVFKIRFARSSYMSLSLIGLQEDADIALYDKRGNLRRIYDNQGTQSELVAGPIRKGVYYVQVFSSSPDETPYRLRLHTVELPPALLGESDRPSTGNETLPRPVVSPTPRPGITVPRSSETRPQPVVPRNPFTGATNLGLFDDTTRTVRDRVGVSDRSDYYQIKITAESHAVFSLTGLSQEARFETYDSQFRLLRRFNNPGTQSELAFGNVLPGTYFVRVVSNSPRDTRYRLTIHTAALP